MARERYKMAREYRAERSASAPIPLESSESSPGTGTDSLRRTGVIPGTNHREESRSGRTSCVGLSGRELIRRHVCSTGGGRSRGRCRWLRARVVREGARAVVGTKGEELPAADRWVRSSGYPAAAVACTYSPSSPRPGTSPAAAQSLKKIPPARWSAGRAPVRKRHCSGRLGDHSSETAHGVVVLDETYDVGMSVVGRDSPCAH